MYSYHVLQPSPLDDVPFIKNREQLSLEGSPSVPLPSPCGCCGLRRAVLEGIIDEHAQANLTDPLSWSLVLTKTRPWNWHRFCRWGLTHGCHYAFGSLGILIHRGAHAHCLKLSRLLTASADFHRDSGFALSPTRSLWSKQPQVTLQARGSSATLRRWVRLLCICSSDNLGQYWFGSLSNLFAFDGESNGLLQLPYLN